MRFPHLTFLFAAYLSLSLSLAADDPPHRKPCTIKSSNSGLDFDLSGLAVLPKDESSKKSKDEAAPESWMAKGYDYGVNFTMNFCAPVVEGIEKVKGVEPEMWRNVSGFYTKEGEIYSIGYVRLKSCCDMLSY